MRALAATSSGESHQTEVGQRAMQTAGTSSRARVIHRAVATRPQPAAVAISPPVPVVATIVAAVVVYVLVPARAAVTMEDNHVVAISLPQAVLATRAARVTALHSAMPLAKGMQAAKRTNRVVAMTFRF